MPSFFNFLKYFCDTNQGLVVNINNNRIVCTKDQIVEFVITHEEKIYFGNIICPSCEELCSVCLLVCLFLNFKYTIICLF